MITIYGKPNCPACNKAKALLEQLGKQYEYVDVQQDESARQFLVEGGYRTVPQVFEDGQLIGDYNALNEHFMLLG